ncbi:MAG: archaellin/type IV pilin N-terminal domain-containing protein [Nanoarchaeota archaeon]
MSQRKKGISPLISWVILIGFAVSLAGVVGVWMKAFAGDTAGKIIKDQEEDLRCIDVTLNVKLNCAVAPERVYVTNTGKFSLKKLVMRQSGQDNSDLDLQSLAPQQAKTEDLKSFDPVKPVDFIPVIDVEGKEVLCNSRIVTTTC